MFMFVDVRFQEEIINMVLLNNQLVEQINIKGQPDRPVQDNIVGIQPEERAR